MWPAYNLRLAKRQPRLDNKGSCQAVQIGMLQLLQFARLSTRKTICRVWSCSLGASIRACRVWDVELFSSVAPYFLLGARLLITLPKSQKGGEPGLLGSRCKVQSPIIGFPGFRELCVHFLVKVYKGWLNSTYAKSLKAEVLQFRV